MPKLPRKIIPNFPYHVTQRGIRRSCVFFNDEDRTRYLNRFSELTKEHGVEVLAYCLMDNHVHHLVVPTDKDGLARVFRPLHSEYALKTNFFHDWTGHLWQNRYFSCLVDDSYFNTVLSYIELNPVRAGMVALAEDYQWSSAKSRVYKLQNPVLSFDKHWVQRIAKISEDWSAWLRYGQREDEIKMIRKKTKQGLPCADPEVVKALEKKYGICLSHKPPGRRPK